MTDPFIAAAREGLDLAIDELKSAVADAPAELLNARPRQDATNSITILAIHSMSSTRWWLCTAVGATLPKRRRDDEFLATTPDATSLLRFVDELHRDCVATLDRAGNVDWTAMRRTYRHSAPDADEYVSAARALVHALEHLREHVGQALLTRQLASQQG